MRTFILKSPLTVPLSKNKKFSLNMNKYRNSHFFVTNKAKQIYKELMAEQIEAIPPMNQIEVTYTINPATKRLFDIGNVGAVIDKFFLDALTELGKIPDDNYKHVPTITVAYGEINKSDPHVHILIKGVEDANNQDY